MSTHRAVITVCARKVTTRRTRAERVAVSTGGIDSNDKGNSDSSSNNDSDLDID